MDPVLINFTIVHQINPLDGRHYFAIPENGPFEDQQLFLTDSTICSKLLAGINSIIFYLNAFAWDAAKYLFGLVGVVSYLKRSCLKSYLNCCSQAL